MAISQILENQIMNTTQLNNDPTIRFYQSHSESKSKRIERIKNKMNDRERRIYQQTQRWIKKEGQVALWRSACWTEREG